MAVASCFILATAEWSTGESGRIPVRNVWLLMLYASRLYRELPSARRVEVEANPDELPELVAEVLTHAVERRLRRNLSFGFQRRSADLDRVRGRIDVLRTERRQLVQRGRVTCRFDELTVDTPQNRFVRAALVQLLRVVADGALSVRCRTAIAQLERAGVIAQPITSSREVHSGSFLRNLGRVDAADRRMLAAAQLAFSLALPTEDAGQTYASSPDRGEELARRLFEKAVGGFYNVALPSPQWKVVAGHRLHWPADNETDGMSNILPGMQTDIELEHRDPQQPNAASRVVIDTKFNSMFTLGRYGNETLHSQYIYQIYAYLRSQERDGDAASLRATGVLLHPAVEVNVDESAVIQGHRIRFATVTWPQRAPPYANDC